MVLDSSLRRLSLAVSFLPTLHSFIHRQQVEFVVMSVVLCTLGVFVYWARAGLSAGLRSRGSLAGERARTGGGCPLGRSLGRSVGRSFPISPVCSSISVGGLDISPSFGANRGREISAFDSHEKIRRTRDS